MKRKKTNPTPRGNLTGVLLVAFFTFVLIGGFWLNKKIEKNYPWLWMVLTDQLFGNETHRVTGTQHILFSMVDHFEPHDQATLDRWIPAYRQVVAPHRDADGRNPQHSFFWYFSQSKADEKMSFLKQLSGLAYEELGEIEIHMHHGGDTSESFTKLMQEAIQQSKSWGALTTFGKSPRTAFGFIHGMWALDNSRTFGECGVNDELIVLRKLGSYADFTHPSWGTMHPRIVNRHFYATDDPTRPKSYDTGSLMEVGKPPVGDLLIFNGPSMIRFSNGRPYYDHNDVTMEELPTEERIDGWVRAGVHVKGRPEWVFVKVHTHGVMARDHEAIVGKWRDRLHNYLEKKYNDGKNYSLHYVSAREAYNIAKAAEAGLTGNPNDYRDYVIPQYVNRYFQSSIPFETIEFDDKTAAVRFLKSGTEEVEVRIKARGVEVSGSAKVLSKEEKEHETVLKLKISGEALVGFRYPGLLKLNVADTKMDGREVS